MLKSLFLFCLIICASFGFSQNNALVLNGAYIRINGGTSANPIFMVVNQPQVNGIIRPGGGHIHSENQYNQVRWVTSTNAGNYIFPFGVGGTAADYIPFEFNKTTAGNANITVSTFSTNTGNLLFANPVNSMPQALNSIDRFWDIRSTVPVTANLIFRYRGIENTITTCANDTVKAQFWNNSAGPWSAMAGPGNPGVTAGIGVVGSIPIQTYFQTTETVWALTTVTISPTISSSASITCNNSNNGSATVITTGGLGPYSFAWLPSGNTGNVATGLTPGIHTVTVTGANSCSQTKTVNILQPPAVTLTVNQTQVTCSTLASATVTPIGGTPTYTAYTWSPAISVTNTAIGLSAGNFTATITDNNGCQTATIVTITSNTIAPIVASANTGSLNCTVLSVDISATTSITPVSYNWSGTGITAGAGTATISVNQPGTFNYTVTNTNNGCKTIGSQTVTQNTSTLLVTASNTTTLNCVTTTAVLTGSDGAGVSYQWSGSGLSGVTTSQNATATLPGTYTLLVTDAVNSCTAQAITVVFQSIAVPTTTASASGILTCSTNTVTLNSTLAGMNYTWSAPPGGSLTNANAQTTSAAGTAGTYSILVVNPTNGCSYSTTTSVIQNTTVPTGVNAGTNQTLGCGSGSVVTLSGSVTTPTNATASWSGTNLSGSTNAFTTSANGSGTFTLTVTNPANDCISTSTVLVNPSSGSPSVTINPVTNTITCTNTLVTVSISSTVIPSTYSWSGAGIVSGNGTATITVSQGGTFNFTLTNTNNSCNTSSNTVVIENTAVPTSTASATGLLTCLTTTVALNSTLSGMSYTWIAPAGGSLADANSQSTSATGAAGDYTLNVVNPTTGCSFTTTTSVSQNIAPPSPTASNTSTLSCITSTVSLTGGPSTGLTYQWLGSGLSGGTTSQNATVTLPGTYTLIVTDAINSCTATATVVVNQNTISPTGVSAGTNQTLTCSSSSIALNGSVTTSTNVILDWGSSVCGSQTTATTFACAAGVYTLTAVDPLNGCIATSTVEVFPNAGAPTPSITSTGLVLDCNNTIQSVTVTSTPSANVTYSWNNIPSNLSSDGSAASFTNANTYICTVTNTISNCSTPIQVVVTSNTLIPTTTVSISGVITCLTNTVTLNSTLIAMNYTWTAPSGGSVTSANTQSTSISGAGDYTLTVVNPSNGCSFTTSITASQNTVNPNGLSAGNNQTLSCSSSSVTLTGTISVPNNAEYIWTGVGVCGTSTTIATEACAAGVYTLTAADPLNGCIATSTVEVFPNAGAPSPSITSTALVLDCNNTSQSVTVTSTPITNVTYSWNNTPSNLSSDGSAASFTNANTYICTVTNTLSNCSTPIQVVVSTNTLVPYILITGSQTLTCANPTAVISTTTTPNTGITYAWIGTVVSGQGTNAVTVNLANNYSVIITDAANGCTNTAISQIYSDANLPSATITSTSSNSIITCQNPTVSLLANVTPLASYSYTWLPSGNTFVSENVTTANTYTLIVLNAITGCGTTKQFTVTGNTTLPNVLVTNTSVPCGSPSVLIGALSTGTNISYNWTTSNGTILSGSNTFTSIVASAGDYVVTVNNLDNGCTNTGTVTVTSIAVTASFTANPMFGTSPLSVDFTNQSTGTIFSWNFADDNNNTSTATNPSHTFNSVGNYLVTLFATDPSGLCSATATLTIEVFENATIIIPNVFTPNDDGSNDLFKITTTGMKDLTCDIFSRWGTKIYTINGLTDAWDGFNATDGTYFYILNCTGQDGKEYKKQGYISLFK
jgi:gliding motility-associated-like protein